MFTSTLVQLIGSLALLTASTSALPIPKLQDLSIRSGPSINGKRVVLNQKRHVKRDPSASSFKLARRAADAVAAAAAAAAPEEIRRQKREQRQRDKLQHKGQHVKRAPTSVQAPPLVSLSALSVPVASNTSEVTSVASATSSAIPTAVSHRPKGPPPNLPIYTKHHSHPTILSNHTESAGPTLSLVSSPATPSALPPITLTVTLVDVAGQYVDQALLPEPTRSGTVSSFPLSFVSVASGSFVPGSHAVKTATRATAAVPTAVPTAVRTALPEPQVL